MVLTLHVGACPQLGYVGVHVGISDYFEDTTSTQSRQHYKEIVLKLNVSFIWNLFFM